MRRLALVLLCMACAHTREDEMTAAEHRNEAQIHTARAAEKRAKFDPGERRAIGKPQGDAEWSARVYNPTQEHLDDADRDMRAAAEHLRAARKLEAFEDARCADIPKEQRGACPLLASSVTRVTETPKGVLLELKASVDAVSTQRMLDCHLAYAYANGFDRPSCPLFVKGMTISLVLGNGGRWIAMTSEDAKVADEIREQARRVFLVEPSVSTRY